jgi:hypothetical protein
LDICIWRKNCVLDAEHEDTVFHCASLNSKLEGKGMPSFCACSTVWGCVMVLAALLLNEHSDASSFEASRHSRLPLVSQA